MSPAFHPYQRMKRFKHNPWTLLSITGCVYGCRRLLEHEFSVNKIGGYQQFRNCQASCRVLPCATTA